VRGKILPGLAREGLALTKEKCQLLAYHEAGHANRPLTGSPRYISLFFPQILRCGSRRIAALSFETQRRTKGGGLGRALVT
jgi:hypothetical protein